jgi:hypothetical protein
MSAFSIDIHLPRRRLLLLLEGPVVFAVAASDQFDVGLLEL